MSKVYRRTMSTSVISPRVMAPSFAYQPLKPLASAAVLEYFYEVKEDEFDGVTVELTKSMSSEVFGTMLKNSLARWRKEGKKGIWIKVPIELIRLADVVVQQGFLFHHAEPKYLMLVNWISECVNTLPANASHKLRVGAFVMNDKREVLMVQEKNGKYWKGLWKLPTGVVEEGEDICDAVVREVKEETAVETEFVEILAFSERHHSFFQKSDLFFMCMLRPLSFEIQWQESEIEAAQWMPWEEFLEQPSVKKSEYSTHVDLFLASTERKYRGFSTQLVRSTYSDRMNKVYTNVGDMIR